MGVPTPRSPRNSYSEGQEKQQFLPVAEVTIWQAVSGLATVSVLLAAFAMRTVQHASCTSSSQGSSVALIIR